jgi:hypothetical protein
MLHWTYIAIATGLGGLLLIELFAEKRWRDQLALAMILVPLILRVLHVK